MKREELNFVAKKVERYLQEECSDYWHVYVEGDFIRCYYINIQRFFIFEEDGEWNITGDSIDLAMAYNLAIVLGVNN